MTGDLGFATLDLDRERRQGLPETLLAHNTGPVLATRIEPDTATTRHAAELIELASQVGPAAEPAVRTMRSIAETEARLRGTLALLEGATTIGTDPCGETVTPTAAALISALPARPKVVSVTLAAALGQP